MSETEHNKAVADCEQSDWKSRYRIYLPGEKKWLFVAYSLTTLMFAFLLLLQVIIFVGIAVTDYELPIIVAEEAHPLPDKAQLPFKNESGVRMIALDTGAPLIASVEQDEAQLAPARYLGWSLYNLDVEMQSWQLLCESRGVRLNLQALQDSSKIVSEWYLLECSLRPGIFSGKQKVSVDQVTRALEESPQLAQSFAYLMWSPKKKTSSNPKKSATTAPPKVEVPDDEPELSPVEPIQPKSEPEQEEPPKEVANQDAALDVDLRTSITGTDVEQTETVIAETGSEQSATVATPETKRGVAIPPFKGQEPAEIKAFADFEGNLPEMDIKIKWDVSEANLVGLLEKYTMAFSASTEKAFLGLDGDWSCYVFKDQKTITDQESWGMDIESALKDYGNIFVEYESLPDLLIKAFNAALPPSFGGEVDQGRLHLGSALLVANDAISSFAAASGKQAEQGAYEVRLVFTQNGEVVADSVKEKLEP